jgi:uncharacterized protein with NAD-binding domain and iron-sulfur cluster
MNGIQFFLREPVSIVEGHAGCMDSPWKVTLLSQAQFWRRPFADTYGDGQVQDCVSAIAADWGKPGVLFGKPARVCTPAQVAREIWEQMKRHFNDTGEVKLTDKNLHSWYLDPGLVWRGDRFHNEDPLVAPKVGSRPNRPDVVTALPNLLLVGDYLESDWQVANMETANYNARRAVNVILDESGSKEGSCATIAPYDPPEWAAAKRVDEGRYKRGQPNILDDGRSRVDSDERLAKLLGLPTPLEHAAAL